MWREMLGQSKELKRKKKALKMILQKSEQDEKFEPVFGKRLFYESDLNGERTIERKKQDVTREEGAEWNPEKECVPPHRTARTHIWYSERDYTFYSARRPRPLARLGVKHTYIYVARRERRNISFIAACSCASSSFWPRIVRLWTRFDIIIFEFRVQLETRALFCFVFVSDKEQCFVTTWIFKLTLV